MGMVKYYDILKNIDIDIGDILDVSSDLFPMILNCRKYKEEFDPNLLIESIIDKIGNEGTIMIRTWNWDFCHGDAFDYYKTPSQVGALGNVALSRHDFKRTKHPLYSFSVWGKYQDYLCSIDNNSAWGSDSPFAFLNNNKGKQLMLGSTMWNSLTYVHFVEEQTGVKYRYLKQFTGEYIDHNHEKSVRSYAMNVRDLDLDIKMTSEKFTPLFFKQSVLKTYNFDGVSVSVVDLSAAYHIIEDDIVNNRSRLICRYRGQKDD